MRRLASVLIAASLAWPAMLGAQTRPIERVAPPEIAREALARLNAVRAAAGLHGFTSDAKLFEAAEGHASYLADRQRVAHEQRDRGAKSFTGATPAERIARVGGEFVAYAELASRAAGGAEDGAADLFVSGVYHRLQLLRPDLDLAGFALRGAGSRRTLVAKLGAIAAPPPRAGLVIWPPHETSVAAAFDTDAESPDPLPERNKAGYPISVQIDTRRRLTVERFELLDAASGERIEAALHQASADPNTPAWAAFLLPLMPLQRDARYRVRFVGTADEDRVEREWTFRTAAATLAGTADAGGGRVRFAIGGLDATETYVVCNGDRATLDGLRFDGTGSFSFERRGVCLRGACDVFVAVAYDLSCRDPIASVQLRLQ